MKAIIVLIILISSTISMLHLKRAYELDRNSSSEEEFKIAQLIFGLTIGYVVFSFLFNKWKQYQQLKNSHAQAQLELLKSKMDPHFFFNTLNNLYGLAIEKSDDTAPIILKLSEVMRYTIYNGEKETVTLRQEIEHLRQYIEIHKIRYKTDINIQLHQELSTEEFLVSPLLFINLLENAFKHGVETLTVGAFINIYIKAKRNRVSFEIENNFLPSVYLHGGTGLNNLKQRLKLCYPKRHTFEVKATDGVYKAKLELTIS
ncbi:histidine kinase [Fabibacter sp. E12]|nr:histidine kinase [Roseivirga sp. E12]